MSRVLSLIERYRTLTTQSLSVFDVTVEEEKQNLLELLLEALANEAPLPFHRLPQDHRPQEVNQLKRAAYYTLLCFGVLEDVANSYFMGSALFLLLVPTMTTSLLFFASLIYASIEGVLFYMFDSYELRVALGVSDSKQSLSVLLHAYESQIKLATLLNIHLGMMSTLSMSDERYHAYIGLLALVNDDLEQKLDLMEKRKEGTLHKIFRLSVMFFGAISSLAGSYFMVTTLMSLVCVSMLTTPIGLAITIATMLLGLSFHYYMDTTSLTRVINPDYETFQAVKEDLSVFKQTYPGHADLLLQQRARYKPLLATHSMFKSEVAANSEHLEPVNEYKQK